MTDPLDVVGILQDLVRIPSVNPMGRDVSGPPFYETRLTDYLQQFFERLPVAWHRQQVAPQRDNIVACLEGRDNEAILVFEVHQDTVPTDGMTIDPWTPTIDHDRLYGRGASDDKGPMAAMLTAFARLAQQRPPGMPTVVMACTVNEENGFSGAQALSRLWAEGNDPLVHGIPHAMVVAEPTALQVVVAHKGVVRWCCHTRGRAAHSSSPERGDNAIYTMGHVIRACEHHAASLAASPLHPRLGAPTFNVGTIQGGICVNAVPDRCSVAFDRRLLPQEDPQQTRQATIDALNAQLDDAVIARVQHDATSLAAPGLSEEMNTDFAAHVQQAVQHSSGNASQQVGVPYATDAPFFAQLGMATVVCGPGSIEQAHTADEWIDLHQLRIGAEAYYCIAANGFLPRRST